MKVVGCGQDSRIPLLRVARGACEKGESFKYTCCEKGGLREGRLAGRAACGKGGLLGCGKGGLREGRFAEKGGFAETLLREGRLAEQRLIVVLVLVVARRAGLREQLCDKGGFGRTTAWESCFARRAGSRTQPCETGRPRESSLARRRRRG